MGTDIHSRIEVLEYDFDSKSTTWHTVTEGIFPYPYFREDEPVSTRNIPFTSQPLVSRHYDLFAVLADVRNGTGFAGIDTGDRVEPLDAPRGIPEDASRGWLDECEGWGEDFHSHSYFTLEELLTDEMQAKLVQGHVTRGVIAERQYLAILSGELDSPRSWAGKVGGTRVRVVTPAEYAAGVRSENEDGTYIRYEWASSIDSATRYLREIVMPTMRRSAPFVEGYPRDEHGNLLTDPARVRLVFAFDN